ncbi:2394_t:CDS:2, partial [Dentiscutata heterogama]
ENALNCKLFKHNTSGINRVCFDKYLNAWRFKTYINTEVFTVANIDDDDILTYLEEQRQKISQINNVDKIFYIKSTAKMMFEQQEKR